MPSFSRIDGEDRKEKEKKGLRQEMRIISAVSWCISTIEKEQKVAGRMTIKGCGPGKMPWRAGSGRRALSCRSLL